ncbi:antibiotic biosynthesis monooxygenase family protein [Cellulomonas chengniuliangii]|uniref:Antibiotic biosynthesis monooxygenase n=1 Tax=Cellulomonas chengniuliangii TaxID=2968084 RepID=A0ABY5L0Z1_9CELL|nr:antibiotic biosynthesis monooxygenase family protein [Cellulomonas chengniuliangii]MCC2309346.1 antibiotic biosynthesis monooxygenase [Cellulomonas chengniuliangii]MCC2316616.1 antibiotic biosynthesis monooxygenase [Cellulomonas chengniuliangii]UUI75085.1 antibiotic biosynthesis monooxygenase [Cellulomonas chengniuliangii]
MYVVHNRLDVKPEEAADFERTFATSMRATLAGVPGLRRSLLMRPTQPGVPYVSTMEFDDQESFRAWMRSDSFKAAHADTGATGMQAPSGIELFDVLEDVVS